MPRRTPRPIPHPLVPMLIRPISDLRNKSQEISELARKSKLPVFITKNGREDLVVLSIAAWEDLYVYPLLLEAELDEAMGDKGRPADEVMDELDKEFGFGKWKGRRKAPARAQGTPKTGRARNPRLP
jgi:prevent-host-death family protein